MEEKIRKFIGIKATYDENAPIIWGLNESNGLQHILDVRGWGAIQNMFIKNGRLSDENHKRAMDFQDELGKWIVEAINEKLEKELTP